jgi:signal transduction histidine kinase
VLFAALYCGLGPALLATLLSATAAAFFFLPPANSLSIGADDAMRLGIFTVVAVVVSSVASARRRAEMRLAEAWHEAERANRAKDHVFAAVSHELRTPMSPVLMAARLIEGDESAPAQVRDDAGMIRRNVELQARLIDDLLDFNRLEHAKMVLSRRDLDVHETVRHALHTCAPEAAAKGVALSAGDGTDLAARHARVSADDARLHQVWANLLRNAIKFTPPGGHVRVRSSDAQEGGRVRVEVSDTGVGIEPEVLPLVFKPFEQGGRDVTRRHGGLGLGLAIVKGIVEAHGGIVTAASDGPGRGATFTVELPATAPAAAPAASPAPGSANAAA